MTRALALKARLPSLAGLGPSGRGLWRWRSELADAYGTGDALSGVARVRAGPDGVLALLELYGGPDRPGERLSATLVWVDAGGGWTDAESVVAARLAAAMAAPPAGTADPVRLKAALPLLAPAIRARLALVRGSRWCPPPAEAPSRELSLRLQRSLREAARRRDLATLATLERALAFLGRGHTAGEALELERLAGLTDDVLGREAARLDAGTGRWSAIEPRLAGVLLFAPD
jgi:hypothetical protein